MKRMTKISLAVYLVILCTIFAICIMRYYNNSKEIAAIRNQNPGLYYNDMANIIKNPDGSAMSPLIIDGRAYLPVESIARLTGLGVKTGKDNNSLMLSSKKTGLSLALYNKDEGPKLIELFKKAYPGVNIKYRMVPQRDGAYESYLTSVLKSGTGVPDVFAVDSSFAKKFIDMPGVFDDLTDRAKDYVDNMIPYTVQVGTDKNGALRALSINGNPGAIAYKKWAAKKYLGTDDPEEIGEMLSTPEKILQTAKTLKENSKGRVPLFPTFQDSFLMYMGGRSQGWVADNKLTIDPKVLDFIDFAKVLRDNKYEAAYDEWLAEWSSAISDDEKALAWICPYWRIPWAIDSNDRKASEGGRWGLVKPIYPFYKGGTWYGIYSKSKNKEIAWEFLKYFTTSNEIMKQWADTNRDLPNNLQAIAEVSPKDSKIMGTDIFKFFKPLVRKINGKTTTKYDDAIDTEFDKAMRLYFEGRLRNKEEVVSTFKKNVKSRLADIIVQ